MFLPSLRRFLAREVMVVVTSLPPAREGHLTLEPVSTPAITFCPYNDSRLVTSPPSQVEQVEINKVATLVKLFGRWKS